MKQHLFAMTVASAVALFGAQALAADPMSEEGGAASTPAPSQSAADLIGDRVVDSKGATVGTVKDVKADSQGNATAVIVDVGTKDVAVPAAEIQIASAGKLVTAKSAREIKKMPAEPATSQPAPSPDMGSGSTPAAPGTPY